MKAISVRQPWASLIVSGEKTVECRTWKTSYRGPLAICASRQPYTLESGLVLPGGVVLGVVELLDVRMMTRADIPASCMQRPEDIRAVLHGYAWHLRTVMECVPVPVKGKLNLFNLDIELRKRPGDFSGHWAYLKSLQEEYAGRASPQGPMPASAPGRRSSQRPHRK
ncbi:ASCH domain-containing protein [Mailhella massiliensis]|uniref:ASCH domain-containing protein n=1 Tax=Mailhella massiliensis TaxID=1903261 RepID=A0A921DTD3_9BACT|nr:ASCH domain-containing protein [Mailhella massiliensis]HJD97967.1 ASCH domain-containing protein [Mailhella massiliensis]